MERLAKTQELTGGQRNGRFKVLMFVALLGLAVPGAVSSTISSIAISGNESFTAREILSWISSRPGLPYSSAVVANDSTTILTRHRESGYYAARVDSVHVQFSDDSSSVMLRFHIVQGAQAVVGGIALQGISYFGEEDILRAFKTTPGRPFMQATLEQDMVGLVTRYEKAGFPVAKCSLAGIFEMQGETPQIGLILVVEEGPRVTIDEVSVRGNSETATSVVVRETRLVIGERFDPGRFQSIQARLRRLNIFSDVAEPELYVRGDRGGILITVKEGNTSTFDGVAGYIPGTPGGESGYFSGMASVSMRNLFGTGRKFAFRWQREDRFSQELGVQYVEPWLFGYPVNLGGGFNQRKQDTTYVRRVLDAKSEVMLTDEVSVALLLNTESVIPSDSLSPRVFRSSTVSLGGELQYDSRDDPYSPTSGARYRTDYLYGRKRIRGVPPWLVETVRTHTSIQRFSVDLDFFLTIFARQVLAIGLHGKELRSAQTEESAMYRFGGARTLRGYREGEFLGSRIAWSNTEYRFLLSRRSFMFGFLDAGYYLRPADEIREAAGFSTFKVGYGAGIQAETALGLIGVSFALGGGDAFINGKMHFGLINEF